MNVGGGGAEVSVDTEWGGCGGWLKSTGAVQ